VYQTSAVEAMAFGSLISATDPVTILSTLQSLGVDPTLYSLVFGESVLNDAVAIALFNSVVNFEEEPVSLTLVLRGAARFLEIFLGSLGIGILLGCLTAFLLQRCGGMRAAVDKPGFDLNSISSGDGETVSIDGDSDNIGGVVDDGGGDGGVSSSSASRIRNVNDHRRLGHHDVDGSAVHVNTETQVREQVTVLALIPYLSYCLAEYLQLSGIVSILFCGFAMSKYAKQYMGKVSYLPRTQRGLFVFPMHART
jgi:NhaP-type Na+/H+ or K+/H+ antiporter